LLAGGQELIERLRHLNGAGLTGKLLRTGRRHNDEAKRQDKKMSNLHD
jgi:hypothetical protein